MTITHEDDLDRLRAIGRIVADTLKAMTEAAEPGMTTRELDGIGRALLEREGAVPAPEASYGFPGATCISVNEAIAHGIPGDRRLIEGDILNIDVTVVLDGWHGDTSRMYAAGQPSTRASKLMDVTYDALMRGVRAVKPGATLGDLGECGLRGGDRRRGLVDRWHPPALCGVELLAGVGGGGVADVGRGRLDPHLLAAGAVGLVQRRDLEAGEIHVQGSRRVRHDIGRDVYGSFHVGVRHAAVHRRELLTAEEQPGRGAARSPRGSGTYASATWQPRPAPASRAPAQTASPWWSRPSSAPARRRLRRGRRRRCRRPPIRHRRRPG